MKLTNEVPKQSGIYWCRYYSIKHKAKRTSIALVDQLGQLGHVVNIFLCGAFTSHEFKLGTTKKFKIMFGDRMEIPDLWKIKIPTPKQRAAAEKAISDLKRWRDKK